MIIINRKIVAWFIFSLTVVLLISFGLIFSYQKSYAGKIYKNVYFSNIDLGGKTKQEAEIILKDHLNTILSESIEIKADSKTVKVRLADSGLSFDYQKAIEESYRVGRSGTFLSNILYSSETLFNVKTMEISPYVDQKKYDEFLKIAVEQLNTEPKDASMEIENGQISLSEGINGQIADTSKLIDQILGLTNHDLLAVHLNTITAEPSIKTADFSEAQSQAETILAKKFHFSFNGKVYTPSVQEIGNWIDVKSDDSGKYQATLNDTKVKAYLNTVAKNFEIKKKDRKINSLTGEVIDEGVNGLYLDKDKTLTAIRQNMGASSITIELPTYEEAAAEVKVTPAEGFVPGRFEGKYIDVDLTQQKLCQIEGNNIVACYTISSGKPSMPTPTGTFQIQNKSRRQWSNKYGLWMPFWQGFNGPYGLHELPEWPNGYKEGQDHLGHPVSHGCVRLGIGDAETVFNWTEIGTPVYIHK